MGRENMARKNSRLCRFGVKLQRYYNFFKFWFEIALNGYLDNFLPESVYICPRTIMGLDLPKKALNALRKIQFTIGTNF